MKLGFLTACLPGSTLTEVAALATTLGYQGLEVAAWPRVAGREWEASHLDVATLDTAGAAEVRELLGKYDLEISAVAYYENNLHADVATRARVHDHLRRCIDAAALLGCPYVGTFVGRDVRLVVENCPMEGWHPDGYPANLAYSPELWDWMAGLGLYLNFDPSHLVWLGIDPVAALTASIDRVAHVQAKDVQTDAVLRNRYGTYGRVLGRTSPWGSEWWRYRIPGLGEVDWRRLVDVLYEAGYDGFVSVEHEDPVWSGTPEKVETGLEIAGRTLRPLLVS
jgi:sugar phosphate isomerase/epimerase